MLLLGTGYRVRMKYLAFIFLATSLTSTAFASASNCTLEIERKVFEQFKLDSDWSDEQISWTYAGPVKRVSPLEDIFEVTISGIKSGGWSGYAIYRGQVRPTNTSCVVLSATLVDSFHFP